MAGQRGAMSTYHLSGPKFHSPLSPGYPAVQGTPVPEALGIVRVPRTDKAVLSIKETDLPGLRGQECPLWICEHPLVPCSPRPSSPYTRASGAGLIQTACVSPPPLEAPPSNFYPASLLFWPSSASLTWPGTLPLGSLQHAFASGPEGPRTRAEVQAWPPFAWCSSCMAFGGHLGTSPGAHRLLGQTGPLRHRKALVAGQAPA